MKNLDFFLNENFQLLEYLDLNEQMINDEICVKKSQDEMATSLNVSKHTINSMIKELKTNGFLLDKQNNGKYTITKEGKEVIEYLTKNKNLEKASKHNCASFFAGVGGIDLGFENVGFKIKYANEFDAKAIHTYELNSDLKVDGRDIHEVADEIVKGEMTLDNHIDIFLAGFPCQAFSIAGYREGFDDKKGRGNLFFEVMKIAQVVKPSVMFLENVKNLVSHDNGKTFRIIRETLESEGYHLKYKVLNSMEYGNVPQNRERIYIVAFKDAEKAERFRFPFPVKLERQLQDVLNYETKEDDRFYYTDRFLHYDQIKEEIKNKDSVYQWRRVYVRENKNHVCPTLTANMGTGGHNVPLIFTDFGIRKLTPRECFNLQGYPQEYQLPTDVAMSCLYKQAGNSVSVSVIERIAKEILKVL